MDRDAPDDARRRRLIALAALTSSLAACGGGGGGASPPGPPPPSLPPPGPPPAPVDGPAWWGFGRDAQHSAVGEVATQPLERLVWSAPVDLAPRYTASGALLVHYGSPIVTRRNAVIFPVKTGAAGGFRVEARLGGNGALLWSLDSDYRLPAHDWLPSFNPLLAGDDGPLCAPAAGGRVLLRDQPDATTGALRRRAFYGDEVYAAAPASYDAGVFINTPLVADRQGNLYFGFSVSGANPAGLVGGIARLGADGSGRWVAASAAAGQPAMIKTAMNSAPALSVDEGTLYVVVNGGGSRPAGRLLALDSATLATRASVPLLDPVSGTAAWVSDNATSSPMVGPDGAVYIGVLEANVPSHNFRGWLLHFDGALAETRTPGAFGWDNTPSVVPAAMLPSYTGPSSYLLALKYNDYGGIGSGRGLHRVAIVDPNQTQPDSYSSATVMREIISIQGPTPDYNYPGGVREWCINTAAVDPLTDSVLMNSEDGRLYRWHLPSNAFTESISLNNGYAQSYTPTAIGADGLVYTVNNARLFAVGR